MSDDFYRAFEDRYRGSRDLIKSRLQIYLPFVVPLLNHYPDGTAIDLGCGRGEWLEVLRSAGFAPHGVDLDEGMLAACLALGLSTEKADAIETLERLPPNSQVIVSAFHVVEHISFEQIRTVVRHAYRTLKPGGILILETPNPENLIVATRDFYLDPTHQRPLPPQLLSFVVEFQGFKRVKLVRMQEATELVNRERLQLHDVLSGVSPDYALVAQKDGSPELTAAVDPLFAKDYGLTLENLSSKYDSRIDGLLSVLQSVILGRAVVPQNRETDAVAYVADMFEKEHGITLGEPASRHDEQIRHQVTLLGRNVEEIKIKTTSLETQLTQTLKENSLAKLTDALGELKTNNDVQASQVARTLERIESQMQSLADELQALQARNASPLRAFVGIARDGVASLLKRLRKGK